MEYADFLQKKQFRKIEAGFEAKDSWIPDIAFDFQRDIIGWSCRRGRSAPFMDTGLGKTLVQTSWANCVLHKENKPILIAAPLCVAQQTVREAEKYGIESTYCRTQPSNKGIHVTNYEMLKNFNPHDYAGIALDESSILKGMDGKMRKFITDFANTIPYRLSCTATPSPNDFMELGTQSEFLSVMSQVEMLAMFFIHDGSDTSKWRLKGHARKRFWEWMASWAVVLRSPADLGYDASRYELPGLNYIEHIVETEAKDSLFVDIAQGLLERNRARRDSVVERCEKAAEIAIATTGQRATWCNLNDESALLKELIPDAVEVKGSDSIEHKEEAILGFADGHIKNIITKPKIAGFGVNWQKCHKTTFCGLSDSFESLYQAIRRFYRFGQENIVDADIIVSDREGAVLDNIKRKESQHKLMQKEMAEVMSDLTIQEIKGSVSTKTDYMPIEKMIKPLMGAR